MATNRRKYFCSKSLQDMSDAEKSDHWGSLASKLGAEPSPKPTKTETAKTPEPPPPPAAETAKATEAKPARRARSQPKPATSSWNALASELGVVPAPETTEEPASRSSSPPTETKKPAARQTARQTGGGVKQEKE